MVDRIARDRFAELLRHYAAGLISNDSFEDNLPLKSKDRAVNTIFWNGAWMLYDDTHEYKLSGEYRLSKRAKREVARWILFLKSDLEYEWPPIRGIYGFPYYLLIILTFGLILPFVKRYLRKAGDEEVWPFLRRTDYDSALANPPYLN